MIRSRPTAPAFTLIELLAVIAIAAIVVTLATVSLSAASAEAVLVKTKAGLAQMDARGRMHARTSGEAVVLVIDSEARLACLIGQHSGEHLAEMVIPQDIGLTLGLPQGMRTLAFDRCGTSPDYSVMVRHNVETRQLKIVGLTGEIIEQEAAP